MMQFRISILFLVLSNYVFASQIHNNKNISKKENLEFNQDKYSEEFFDFGEDLSAYDLFKNSKVKDSSIREKPQFEEADLFFDPVLSESRFDGVEEGDDSEITIEMPYTFVSPKRKSSFKEKDE